MKKETDSPNETKKQATWKDAFLEILVPLAMGFVIFCIAAFLVCLFPSDIRKDITDDVFDIFMMIASFIFIFIFGIVFWIVQTAKARKKTKNLKWIQNHFKGKYHLVLMMVTKKFTNEDLHLLRGRTEAGKFDLYKENDGFLFVAEYSSGPIEKRTQQFQLQNIDEAILYIENFMRGNPISD